MIETLFLRDINHGGSKRQPATVARRLAEFVGEAASTLDIAIYDFRLGSSSLAKSVVGALSNAAERGVTVRLAYDAGKPTDTTASTFALMGAEPGPDPVQPSGSLTTLAILTCRSRRSRRLLAS